MQRKRCMKNPSAPSLAARDSSCLECIFNRLHKRTPVAYPLQINQKLKVMGVKCSINNRRNKRRGIMKRKVFAIILTGLFIFSGIAYAESTSVQTSVDKASKIAESSTNPEAIGAPAAAKAASKSVDEDVKSAAKVPANSDKAALPDKQAEAFSSEK